MWEGKDDDNGGLVYGIEYTWGEEVTDCEWFSTEQDRDNHLKSYLNYLRTTSSTEVEE